MSTADPSSEPSPGSTSTSSPPRYSPIPPPPEIATYFTEHVPNDWFTELVVEADKDEIFVTMALATPKTDGDPGEACRGTIADFREASREQRVAIAGRAEHLFGRKVSWAAQCGEVYQPFTMIAVPAMTRLCFRERAVLDTLIAGGVARSRSEALAWCVEVVAAKHHEWIQEMVDAVAAMEKVRRTGPR